METSLGQQSIFDEVIESYKDDSSQVNPSEDGLQVNADLSQDDI
jgi:hypothetical protein